MIEVREYARVALSTLVEYRQSRTRMSADRLILCVCKTKRNVTNTTTDNGNKTKSIQTNNREDLSIRHADILELCVAHPDDLPDYTILLFLTQHQFDIQPIPKSISAAINLFKRAHLLN